MGTATSFDALLDAIEELPSEQQSDLIDVVRRRIADRARLQIAADAIEAREEHRRGETKIVSANDLKRELGL